MKLSEHTVHRASLKEIEVAFGLVTEYYDEVRVVAREDREKFEEQYFGEGSGVWMAVVEGGAVGCVALRKLVDRANCGEIKRMYVRSLHRGKLLPSLCSGHWKNMRLHVDMSDCIRTRPMRWWRQPAFMSGADIKDASDITIIRRRRCLCASGSAQADSRWMRQVGRLRRRPLQKSD